MTLDQSLARVEVRIVLRALRAARGHRAAAAAALGVSLSRLQRILARVPRETLDALTRRHGWPTRQDLAAFARQARARE